jgi:hypothetical protein
LKSLAAKDRSRGLLFSRLEKINKVNKFPLMYKTQLAIARSYLVRDKNYSAIDSIVFISRQLADFDRKKGNVYFFKYRVKKQDDWKIGISGLQPENIREVSSNDKLSFLTDKRVKDNAPTLQQFQEQLKKILFKFHKSAGIFFEDDANGYHFKRRMPDED